ncbi:MAG: hypothetical protein R3F17_08000 [Planctomycetota bacterium]
MTRAAYCIALLMACASCQATIDATFNWEPDSDVGPELQVYPAGVIGGVRWEWPNYANDVWFGRFGYNRADRGDFGEHDSEEGGGFGLGTGWRRWNNETHTGWHYGARVDVWKLEIDWRDQTPVTSGTSKTLVLQPTLEGGYSWPMGEEGRLDLTLGLGAEINLDTDGEDVGEGAILLLGVSFIP